MVAAFVLPCQGYCACGHFGPAVGAKPVPACHAKGHGKTQDKRHDDSACQHCKRGVNAATGPTRTVGLDPLGGPVTAVAPVVFVASFPHAGPHLVVAGDLPPPRAASSLLRLHCALNT